MRIKALVIYSALIFSMQLFAGLGDFSNYATSKGEIREDKLASDLVDEGLYFTAIPLLKESVLDRAGNSTKLGQLIDRVMDEVGSQQFQLFPVEILKSYNNPYMSYLSAKKYFREGKIDHSLELLNVDNSHPVAPFVLSLKGTILALKNKNKDAIQVFKDCISLSKKFEGRNDGDKKRQYFLNGEACNAGIPRALFAMREFDEANDKYLDVLKSSPIWPEILFEEAWNSFYQRDYNRTLGKLVTYKAPIFDHVFNPEIDILTALTYLELCLYEDAKNTVEDFYKRYQNDSDILSRFLQRSGRNYKNYYMLAKNAAGGSYPSNKLLSVLLKDIVKDPLYREMYNSFKLGKNELQKVKDVQDRRLRVLLLGNLKDTLLLQRDLIGSYVKRKLASFSRQLDKGFEGMSYIKLEILSRRKEAIYMAMKNISRERGNLKNVMRSDKQYFWTFNGEFWADELGDYVFALKSECSK